MSLDKADYQLSKHIRVDEIDEITRQLMLLCNNSNIVFQQHYFTDDKFFQFVQTAPHPLLVFETDSTGVNYPLIIKKVTVQQLLIYLSLTKKILAFQTIFILMILLHQIL